MPRAVTRAALIVLSLSLAAFVGCSRDPVEPERTRPKTTRQPTVVEGTGGEGYFAGTPKIPPHGVVVEDAELRPGAEDDQIVARVSVGSAVISPDCYVIDESARTSARNGEIPMVLESDWADDRLTDKFERDNTFVVVFYEERPAPQASPDQRLRTLYVGCYGRGMTAYDEARVER